MHVTIILLFAIYAGIPLPPDFAAPVMDSRMLRAIAPPILENETSLADTDAETAIKQTAIVGVI